MNTRNIRRNRFLLLSLLLQSAALAWAGGSGVMKLPYMPPIDMMQTGHTASPAAVHDQYGQVVQTMDSGGYTYVQLDTGKKKIWAAGPITALKKGDDIKVGTNMPMRNFYSKTLKRKFDLIYFSNSFVIAGQAKPKTGMNPHHGMQPQASAPIAGIKKAKHGKTVAEIYRERKQLAGKRVRVRGKVIKYIGNIYGKNWLHIQDSSSNKNLLVITADKSHPDVVLVEGKVTLNKDNGIGHVYKVVLDDAKLLKK